MNFHHGPAPEDEQGVHVVKGLKRSDRPSDEESNQRRPASHLWVGEAVKPADA